MKRTDMELECEPHMSGCVYAITNGATDDVYIGCGTSTFEKSMNKRFEKHVTRYRCWKVGKWNFESPFIVLEHPQCRIEMLEWIVNCNSKDQLKKRQLFYINGGYKGNCINYQCKFGPTTTYADYQVKVKENVKTIVIVKPVVVKPVVKPAEPVVIVEPDVVEPVVVVDPVVKRAEKITCGCGSVIVKRYGAKHILSKKHCDWLKENPQQ